MENTKALNLVSRMADDIGDYALTIKNLRAQLAERDAQLAAEVTRWANVELAYCRAQKATGAVYILEKLLRELPSMPTRQPTQDKGG